MDATTHISAQVNVKTNLLQLRQGYGGLMIRRFMHVTDSVRPLYGRKYATVSRSAKVLEYNNDGGLKSKWLQQMDATRHNSAQVN